MPSGCLHNNSGMIESNCGAAGSAENSTMQTQIVFEQGG